MKKIMVLGAGVYQVPLIKQARAMGHFVIVVSPDGNFPGFQYADKIYNEDIKNSNEILAIARQEKIAAIVTAGADAGVITIGTVCDALGLPGVSRRAAEISSNKMLMKSTFEKCGARTARFRIVHFIEDEIARAAQGLRFPLIFKAVDNSGSRGIIKVENPCKFDAALEVVRGATRLDYFIMEEFLDGVEFGAQAFVDDGELKLILPHGDYVFKGDTGVPIGHFAPYDLPNEICQDIEEQLMKTIAGMGLNNCAINADFMLYEGLVYVLEIGARSGATCLAETVSIYYGYNYYEKIISAAMGEKPDFSPAIKIPLASTSMLFMSNKTGTITSLKYNIPDQENLFELCFDYKEGDSVRKFSVGSDRIGHIIVVGKTVDEAKHSMDKAIQQIEITVQ